MVLVRMNVFMGMFVCVFPDDRLIMRMVVAGMRIGLVYLFVSVLFF